MIKNAIIFKRNPLAMAEDAFAAMAFLPTAPTQEKSLGWVPARGIEHAALVESISGAAVFMLKLETRKVPAATLVEELDKACKHIEANTGRKPGRKERAGIKDELVQTLLPKAFPTQKTALCIADGDMLVVATSSAAMADEVIGALVRTDPATVASVVNTVTSPTAAMACWLTEQEAPAGFDIGNACELKAADESGAKVRYAKHPLLTEEVKTHIAQGKQPTSLELVFDDRISFTLTDALHLKKMEFADEVMFQAKENGINPGDFDGTMAIAIGELRGMLPSLLGALGGEPQPSTHF